MNPEIEQLKKDVAELLQWKKDRMSQQLTAPFDARSQTVLSKYFPKLIKVFYIPDLNGHTVPIVTLFNIDNSEYFLGNAAPMTTFKADLTTYLLYVNQNQFKNGDQVYVNAVLALPTPLDSTTKYWVVNTSGNQFKLSLTSGGAAINLTDNGSGELFISNSF